jgi:hypothetical protein
MGIKQTGTIDWSKFGALLRLLRVNSGFRKGETFVGFMEQETGYKVSADTLYRVENGSQEPPLSLFIAINLTLGKAAVDDELIAQTMSARWKARERENLGAPVDTRTQLDGTLYYDDEI